MTFERLKTNIAISLVIFTIMAGAIISFGLLEKNTAIFQKKNLTPDNNVIITNRTDKNKTPTVNETIISNNMTGNVNQGTGEVTTTTIHSTTTLPVPTTEPTTRPASTTTQPSSTTLPSTTTLPNRRTGAS